ncbi:hypothetical protein BH18CHL2_BH18CHL2_03440 [soil metagenome]
MPRSVRVEIDLRMLPSPIRLTPPTTETIATAPAALGSSRGAVRVRHQDWPSRYGLGSFARACREETRR